MHLGGPEFQPEKETPEAAAPASGFQAVPETLDEEARQGQLREEMSYNVRNVCALPLP